MSSFSYIFFAEIFTLFLIAVSFGQVPFEVPFKHCKPGPKSVTSVLINPCGKGSLKSKRCIINQDTRIKVNAVFIPPFNASSDLEIVATVNLMGKVISLPESGNDPCQENIVPWCPLKKGRMYIFKTVFNVIGAFPAGSADVKYSIRDKKINKVIGCAIIPIAIPKERREL